MRRPPGRRPRAEDDEIYGTFLGFGAIATLSDGDPAPRPDVAGRLIVPDPEQRNGWREFYVHHDMPAPKPGARPLGFGRP